MKKLYLLTLILVLMAAAALPCFAAPTPGEYTEAVTKEATCTAEGIKVFTNVNDPSDTYEVAIPELGHQWGLWKQIEGSDGMMSHVCRRCGFEERDKVPVVIPPPLKPLPVFNTVDAVFGGVTLVAIVLFAMLLLPVLKEIKRERRAYATYSARRRNEENEAAGHSFT